MNNATQPNVDVETEHFIVHDTTTGKISVVWTFDATNCVDDLRKAGISDRQLIRRYARLQRVARQTGEKLWLLTMDFDGDAGQQMLAIFKKDGRPIYSSWRESPLREDPRTEGMQ